MDCNGIGKYELSLFIHRFSPIRRMHICMRVGFIIICHVHMVDVDVVVVVW